MRKVWLAVAMVAGAVVAGAMVALPAPAQAQVTCGGLPVTIFGTDGNDTIVGTSGNDVIAADNGDDSVRALEGNDTVCLGRGNDKLDGGPGADTSVAEAVPDGKDTFIGGADAVGKDLVSYAARTTPVAISLDGVADDGAPGEGDNSFGDVDSATGGSAGDIITGNKLDNRILGGAGNDTLTGQLGNDVVAGQVGNDTYFAGVAVDGKDSFTGGPGVDTASYVVRVNVTSNAVLSLSLDGVANDGEQGEGDNLLADVENAVGGTGRNDITGNTSANVLTGGKSADKIHGADGIAGNDRVDGRLGVDLCTVDPGDLVVNCEL